jgi:hypothetical protein
MVEPAALLGLPLGEALDRVRAAGRPAPAVVRAEPPRARHPYPPDEAWRVIRVREAGGVLELVAAPPIPPPAPESSCSS